MKELEVNRSLAGFSIEEISNIMQEILTKYDKVLYTNIITIKVIDDGYKYVDIEVF